MRMSGSGGNLRFFSMRGIVYVALLCACLSFSVLSQHL